MEKIWLEYHSKLQVYLKQLFPTMNDPEERVSEILLTIFDRLDSYNPAYALSTWIYMLARNIQIDALRRRSIEKVELDETQLQDKESPEKIYLIKESKEAVHRAIEDLSPTDREITFLYYFEDMKVREISEITSTAQGTIKYRLMRIREILKDKIIMEVAQ